MSVVPKPGRRYISGLYGGIILSCSSLIEKELPGAHSYLVGSALTATTRPRDIDVRIVLDDDAFRARFGVGGEVFGEERHTWPRSDAFWSFIEFEERARVFIAHACGERMIDLGIVPASIFALYDADPREALWPREKIAPSDAEQPDSSGASEPRVQRQGMSVLARFSQKNSSRYKSIGNSTHPTTEETRTNG